jgi:hypothetical protein
LARKPLKTSEEEKGRNEKLAAFIVATNERLDRMEARLDEVVKSITILPETKAKAETLLKELQEMNARLSEKAEAELPAQSEL